MRRSLAVLLGLASLTVAFAGCEADHVVVAVCSGSSCCNQNQSCQIHGEGSFALEPIPGGALFLADVAAPAIYRLSPLGGYERIAGTGEPGETGDGVPARAAAIGPPSLLGLDPADGGLVFRELSSGAVRKIDSRGILGTPAPAAR